LALVLGRRDGRVRFCGVTAVLATLLAAGPATPLYGWAYRALPLFSLFRYPSKWFLAATLALAALAALGLDRLGARDPADGRLARRMLSVVLVIILALAAGLVLLILQSDLVVAKLAPEFPTAGLQLAAGALGAITRSGLEALAFLLTTWLLLALLVRTRASVPVIQGLLLVVLTLDLVLHNARMVPLGPPALLEAEPDLARALTADPDLFRVHREEVASRGGSLPSGSLDLENPTLAISWEHRKSLHENLGMPYSIQAFRGHTSARLGDFDRMVERFAGRPDYPRLLGLWNVKYMIAVGGPLDSPSLEAIPLPGSDDRIHLYRNRALGPRAWWVPRARRMADHARALAALTDFDPEREVLLEEPVASDEGNPSVAVPGGATVTVARYAPLEILVECRAPAPGYLVLADTHYPGWRATVDGRESPVLRANYAMRAVALPPGSHTVRFRYEPGMLRVGAVITGASLAGWTALGVVVLWRRRRAAAV
jgi:Bacterial membrane protein YfhO